MARKRAPGGGRKPRGEFENKSRTLTTRITAATREALERAAKKSDRSLSQEIERRLDNSIKRDRQLTRQGHIRALAESIALVGERVEKRTERNWLRDPFTGEALRHAIEFLVFHFAAQGMLEVPPNVEAAAARMPPEVRDRYLTPVEVGQHEAGWLISLIEMDLNQGGRLFRPKPPARPEAHVPDEWYTYARLFADLKSDWARAQKAMKKEKHR